MRLFFYCLILTVIVRPALGNELSYSVLGNKNKIIADIGASTRYVYNIYYDDKRAVNDGVLQLKPLVYMGTKPGWFVAEGQVAGLSETFLTNTNQNHFDYKGLGYLRFNNTGRVIVSTGGTYNNFSDPAPNEIIKRTGREQVVGEILVNAKAESGSTLDFTARYGMEKFTQDQLLYTPSDTSVKLPSLYDNNYIEGIAQYTNAFLPETRWFLRATGGTRNWTNNNLDTLADTLTNVNQRVYSQLKANSIWGIAETGFQGRLSDKATVDSAVGWHLRLYSPAPYWSSAASADQVASNADAKQGFSAPVFYFRFTEQLTRRDQFLVGYNYIVDDAYYSNYLINQEIYLGVIKVLGDQLMMMGRFAYEYRSFSLPNRREDERIDASIMAKYSITANVKITADIKVDFLSSDAYDNNELASLPVQDRPASYRAGSLGIGMVASF